MDTACLGIMPSQQQSKPLHTIINIEGNAFTMEVDTGAVVFIISDKS